MNKYARSNMLKAISTLLLLGIITTSLIAHLSLSSVIAPQPKDRHFRIRTITAGVNLKNTNDTATLQSAVDIVLRAKQKFEAAGYEVQTVRIATQPVRAYLAGKLRDAALGE